eukprot:403350399
MINVSNHNKSSSFTDSQTPVSNKSKQQNNQKLSSQKLTQTFKKGYFSTILSSNITKTNTKPQSSQKNQQLKSDNTISHKNNGYIEIDVSNLKQDQYQFDDSSPLRIVDQQLTQDIQQDRSPFKIQEDSDKSQKVEKFQATDQEKVKDINQSQNEKQQILSKFLSNPFQNQQTKESNYKGRFIVKQKPNQDLEEFNQTQTDLSLSRNQNNFNNSIENTNPRKSLRESKSYINHNSRSKSSLINDRANMTVPDSISQIFKASSNRLKQDFKYTTTSHSFYLNKRQNSTFSSRSKSAANRPCMCGTCPEDCEIHQIRASKPLFDPERYRMELQNDKIRKIRAMDLKTQQEQEKQIQEDMEIQFNLITDPNKKLDLEQFQHKYSQSVQKWQENRNSDPATNLDQEQYSFKPEINRVSKELTSKQQRLDQRLKEVADQRQKLLNKLLDENKIMFKPSINQKSKLLASESSRRSVSPITGKYIERVDEVTKSVMNRTSIIREEIESRKRQQAQQNKLINEKESPQRNLNPSGKDFIQTNKTAVWQFGIKKQPQPVQMEQYFSRNLKDIPIKAKTDISNNNTQDQPIKLNRQSYMIQSQKQSSVFNSVEREQNETPINDHETSKLDLTNQNNASHCLQNQMNINEFSTSFVDLNKSHYDELQHSVDDSLERENNNETEDFLNIEEVIREQLDIQQKKKESMKSVKGQKKQLNYLKKQTGDHQTQEDVESVENIDQSREIIKKNVDDASSFVLSIFSKVIEEETKQKKEDSLQEINLNDALSFVDRVLISASEKLKELESQEKNAVKSNQSQIGKRKQSIIGQKVNIDRNMIIQENTQSSARSQTSQSQIKKPTNLRDSSKSITQQIPIQQNGSYKVTQTQSVKRRQPQKQQNGFQPEMMMKNQQQQQKDAQSKQQIDLKFKSSIGKGVQNINIKQDQKQNQQQQYVNTQEGYHSKSSIDDDISRYIDKESKQLIDRKQSIKNTLGKQETMKLDDDKQNEIIQKIVEQSQLQNNGNNQQSQNTQLDTSRLDSKQQLIHVTPNIIEEIEQYGMDSITILRQVVKQYKYLFKSNNGTTHVFENKEANQVQTSQHINLKLKSPNQQKVKQDNTNKRLNSNSVKRSIETNLKSSKK